MGQFMGKRFENYPTRVQGPLWSTTVQEMVELWSINLRMNAVIERNY